jgi:hypothetical protein
MIHIERRASALNGLAAALILLAMAVVPIAGCSRFQSSTEPDESTASAVGSSMKVEGSAPASETAAASAPAAVPAPAVPPVTSPTAPALAAAAPVSPSPVAPANAAQASPPAAAVVASSDAAPALKLASVTTPVLNGVDGSGMQGAAQALNPAMIRALKQFQVASAAFPDFCREWAHKLSVREHDNVSSIKWLMHNGVETGSYVGYGAIDSCTCKEATNGVAVGVLTYKEFDYTLTGKSIEEAKHATPHATAVVPTREIFAYEKGKWFW